jgi:hypothetical protein
MNRSLTENREELRTQTGKEQPQKLLDLHHNTRIRSQKLHRPNSPNYKLIPQKSLSGTVPNSGKLRSKPTTKMKKNKNKNHSFKIGTPEGKRRIWASISTPNLNKIHHENSDHVTSLMKH